MRQWSEQCRRRRSAHEERAGGRRAAGVGLALAVALSLAACGGGGGAGGPARSNAAAGATGSLKGLCPDPVVVQTSWAPQVEHAVVYQLLGAGYRVDADRKRVVGPLVSRGIDTGVRLEIRAGGPAIGFEQVSAQMYLDKTITIGMLATDEAVANSLRQPTTAVLAPFDIDPLMIMWDPKKHPSFNTEVISAAGSGCLGRYPCFGPIELVLVEAWSSR